MFFSHTQYAPADDKVLCSHVRDNHCLNDAHELQTVAGKAEPAVIGPLSSTSVGPPDNQFQLLQIHKAVWHTGKPNMFGCKIPLPSGLNIPAWRHLLQDYHDQQLLDCLEFGFPIGYSERTWPTVCNINHSSALAFPKDVEQYIDTEIMQGAMLGPFNHAPFRVGLHTSPLMTRPKKQSHRRVIMDLSWPAGASVNSGIPKETYLGVPYKLRYPSVDDMVQLIRQYGVGSLLFVADIKRAYRNLRCDPLDWPLTGLMWDNKLYVDTSIAFGLRTGAYFCQRMTNALQAILAAQHCTVLNYIDDICGISPQDVASSRFNCLLDTLKTLGLPIAEDKIQPPSTCVTWLGVTFDTLDMSYSICKDKIEEVMYLIRDWRNKTHATVNELQKLLGKLLYIASCCKPARLFVSRMLQTLRDNFEASHPVMLDTEFKKDINWFVNFLPVYNGISIINRSPPAITVEVDSCLTRGAGLMGKYFYSCQFPEFILQQFLHISCLEMLNLVVAVKLWSNSWAGKSVIINCDNSATVDTIQHGRARDKFLLKCARVIWFHTARLDIDLQVKHKPGVLMHTVDSLSRLNEHSADNIAEQLLHRGLIRVEVDNRLFLLVECF